MSIYQSIPNKSKLSTILVLLQILYYLGIFAVIAAIIYALWWLYNKIKTLFTSAFGTQDVNLGGVCTTHNDCIGWVPAKIGAPGCCTANGKSAGLGVKGTCQPLKSDGLGWFGYCPNEIPL